MDSKMGQNQLPEGGDGMCSLFVQPERKPRRTEKEGKDIILMVLPLSSLTHLLI